MSSAKIIPIYVLQSKDIDELRAALEEYGEAAFLGALESGQFKDNEAVVRMLLAEKHIARQMLAITAAERSSNAAKWAAVFSLLGIVIMVFRDFWLERLRSMF